MPKRQYMKCYFGCVTSGPFHRFPSPDYQLDRFNLWKAVLPSAVQNKGDLYIYQNIKFCRNHFKDCYRLPSNRLTGTGIPTLDIHMESMRWNTRRCSVMLRRCDSEGRGRAASLDALRVPHRARYYVDKALVVTKLDVDAEDPVAMRGLGTQLTHPSEDIDIVVKEESDLFMKTENEIDDLVVKEELDIGPTVLQQKIPHCPISSPIQAYVDARSNGSSGVPLRFRRSVRRCLPERVQTAIDSKKIL